MKGIPYFSTAESCLAIENGHQIILSSIFVSVKNERKYTFCTIDGFDEDFVVYLQYHDVFAKDPMDSPKTSYDYEDAKNTCIHYKLNVNGILVYFCVFIRTITIQQGKMGTNLMCESHTI